MPRDLKHFYDFGSYSVDESERLLLRGDEVVPLTPKAFEMLLVLVESSGHVLTKEELMKRVWPDTIVEEANLSHNIYKLREALGEAAAVRSTSRPYRVAVIGSSVTSPSCAMRIWNWLWPNGYRHTSSLKRNMTQTQPAWPCLTKPPRRAQNCQSRESSAGLHRL